MAAVKTTLALTGKAGELNTGAATDNTADAQGNKDTGVEQALERWCVWKRRDGREAGHRSRVDDQVVARQAPKSARVSLAVLTEQRGIRASRAGASLVVAKPFKPR